jgi:hypothetical protein
MYGRIRSEVVKVLFVGTARFEVELIGRVGRGERLFRGWTFDWRS